MLEAGVGDHGVDLTVALPGGRDRIGVALPLGEVHMDVNPSPEVDAQHVPAIASQPLHDCGADPAGGR